MNNKKQKGDCVKQSSAPELEVKRKPINDKNGKFIRAKFLSGYSAKHFEEMDEKGFSPQKDIPIVMEFFDRLYDCWMDYLEENGIELIFPNK